MSEHRHAACLRLLLHAVCCGLLQSLPSSSPSSPSLSCAWRRLLQYSASAAASSSRTCPASEWWSGNAPSTARCVAGWLGGVVAGWRGGGRAVCITSRGLTPPLLPLHTRVIVSRVSPRRPSTPAALFFCRFLLHRQEIGNRDMDVIQLKSHDTLLVHEPKQKVDLTHYTSSHQFVFDEVRWAGQWRWWSSCHDDHDDHVVPPPHCDGPPVARLSACVAGVRRPRDDGGGLPPHRPAPRGGDFQGRQRDVLRVRADGCVVAGDCDGGVRDRGERKRRPPCLPSSHAAGMRHCAPCATQAAARRSP